MGACSRRGREPDGVSAEKTEQRRDIRRTDVHLTSCL